MSKNTAGRPPKYTSKEEIEILIDQYFKDCEGTLLKDEETGKILFDKYDRPVYIGAHPPTVTGLALALGFKTRISLLDYQGKAEFRDTILKAKSKIEQYTEERLFDRDGSNGAKFSLQNNFKRWKDDKSAAENKPPVINVICDIPDTLIVENDDTTETETEKETETEAEDDGTES